MEHPQDADIWHLYWYHEIEKFVIYYRRGPDLPSKDWLDAKESPSHWRTPEYSCYIIYEGVKQEEGDERST